MPHVGETWNQFELLQALGSGGMGEVFLALDTSLDRKVAVKFLPASLSASRRARERFSREAKSAARLDHPYICKIFEVGDKKGTPFIVMEYIEGQTLKDRLERGAMRLSDILQLGSEVVEAVDAAHRKGVVHRDLKPANIMVTLDGHVKVMDFGLATTVGSEGQGETLSGKLTSRGATPGTVSYMSPEQVRGEALDARSDVFSLGVVLYEMATGAVPFRGATSGVTYDAILNRGAPPPRSVNEDIPAELDELIQRCLAKDPSYRYQTATELMIDLRLLSRTTDSETIALADLRSVKGAETKRATRRFPTWGVAAVAVLALVAAALLFRGTPTPAPGGEVESLAVLPFDNAQEDPAVDYLSDGIAENLINRLSQIEELRVMARSSSFRFRGPDIDPQRVGSDLGVGAVVTGRVVQQGTTLNVQAELVDVASGMQLWGEQYTRELPDLVAITNDIANDISDALRLGLTSDQRRRITLTASGEAYRAYLMGRHLWNKRTNPDLKRAVGLFEEARDLDPDFALAYVGLADCYALLGAGFYGVDEDFPAREAIPKAMTAALEAHRLDDSLAAAHATLGFLRFMSWEWDEAETEFRRAISLDPSYATAHQWYAQYLAFMGRHREALSEQSLATALEPASPLQNRQLGFILSSTRNLEKAADQLEKTLELDSDFPLVRPYLAGIYWLLDEEEEAVATVDGPLFERYFELLRDEKPLEASAHMANAEGQALSPLARALYFGLAGDSDRVLEVLEEAVARRDPQLVTTVQGPFLDSVRDDPRFQRVLARMGVP